VDSGVRGLHRAGGFGILDRINGICRIGIIRFTNDVSYKAMKRKIASFTRVDQILKSEPGGCKAKESNALCGASGEAREAE
jgi:hypothetical protein